MSEPDHALAARLREESSALGFARCGFAAADALEDDARRLREFLAEGRHGEMQWLEGTVEQRQDPRHTGILPSARTVIVLAAPYARDASRVGPAPGRVARYARGRDYHNVLLTRVRKLARTLRAHGHTARPSVDTLPVFERAWAQRAGVGFIGKNCCLIVPGLGSHVLLATVLTSALLPVDAPMPERCGSCRACLDGCPTQAFVGPRALDARRCIAYLTIEHEGPIEPSLRAPMGDWLFGCDACQDVCPFNRTQPPSAEATAPFAPDARWETHDAAALLGLSDAAFAAYAQASPVQRTGRAGLARNAAIVLGNSRDRRHLPVLREAAASHDSATVRDAAAWAIERLDETVDDS